MEKFFDNLDDVDLLFKDFFNCNSLFTNLSSITKIGSPVDVREVDDKLIIEIAAVGVDKDDITVEIEDNSILRVKYDRDKKETTDGEKCFVLRSGISRKSFNMGWKIGQKYDISTVRVTLDKGLLSIVIDKSKNLGKVKVTIE